MRLTLATLLALCVWAQAWGDSAVAQSPGEACIEALASDGTRWDGGPMEPFTWDGTVAILGQAQGLAVSLCPAGGPPEILPMTQRIGCVLLGDMPVPLSDGLACGAYTDVRIGDDGALIWIARNNVATNQVTVFDGRAEVWLRRASYLACWDDPNTPVVTEAQCGG